MDNTAYFDLLQSTFHGAPCTLHIPQRLEIRERGVAQVTLLPDGRYHHAAGRIHGGILSLLIDNAGYFAAASVTDGFWVVTTEFKINLLDSVAGEPVVATGSVLRQGRHLIHAEMEASTEDGTPIAVGLGTYTILPRRFSAS